MDFWGKLRGSEVYGKIRNFQHFLGAVWEVIKAGYPARNLIVIGVTGTDGKTTTSHLIFTILHSAGIPVALISSIGAFIEDEDLDTGFHVTTPDPRQLQPLLSRFKNQGITHVVLEATSHGLDQHRVLGCNFKVGVLTNITHEHLDYHKTWERYRDAKAKLFCGVDVAVLNSNDKSFDYMKAVASNARVISYSIGRRAVLEARKIKLTPQGCQFEIQDGRENIKITTSLLGKYNVSNILAAAGAARGLGVSWGKIKNGIEDFNGLVGRLERIDSSAGSGQDFTVFIDFAHTPGGLENVLALLNKIKPKTGKLITVFGAAGERDRAKRWLMGEVSARLADFSVLTAEDPRTEDPEKIIDDIARGVRQKAKVWDGTSDWRRKGHWCIKIPERGEAIAFAIQKLAKGGDIVVICGKGHERSMAYDHTEYPWSDQEAARIAFEGGVKRVRP